MRYLHLEVSFEKRAESFGNSDRTVTSKESVYWFGTTDAIMNLPEVVMNVVKGHFDMHKKNLTDNYGKSEFHIFGTSTNVNHTDQQSVFRFSIYTHFGAVDRVYIKTYNQPQVCYDSDTPDKLEYTIPKIKGYVNHFLREWFSDEKNITIK